MKKSITLSSFLPMMILALGAGLAPVQGQVVNFTDPVAEEAIRDELNKASGDIKVSDLAKVETLDISFRDINTLSLPEGLVNLEELFLNNNNLSGTLFSPLRLPEDLESLKILDISANKLAGTSFLAAYTTLEELNLSRNGMTKLTLPETLTNILYLDVSGNELTELNLPPGPAELLELEAGNNLMEAFTLPEGYTKLEKIVLERNNLTELNLPSDLDSIIGIELQRNDLVEIEMPEGLETLESLEIWENKLTTVTLPTDLTGLIRLDLFNNQLVEFELPDGLRALEILDLRDNPLELVIISQEIVDRFRVYLTDQINPATPTELVIRIPPRPAPEILEIVRTDKGDLEFTISGAPGEYEVFSSETVNKEGSFWTPVGIFETDENGVFRYADKTVRNEPFYYYRVQEVLNDTSGG